ncbi:hemerythrin domain-containing protein [Novosphingobium sp.]|uniref:hemerythrin domain-containing protein n=1 Tax=Novosphingobium sp. TaxID=1874826 RepID=UPI002FDDFB5B
MLRQDHRDVEKLFKEYESAGRSRKEAIIAEVCKALTLHTMLEEEVFYPACRDATSDEDDLDEAQVEHDSAKLLIADLMAGDRRDPFRDAKVKVLSEQILHHVKEEEGDDGIFAEAREKGVDTPELAERLKQRRGELEAEDRLPPQAPVSFGASTRDQSKNTSARSTQERTTASYQNRDRDDDDRFTGGGRHPADDDRRYSRGQDRPRDEDGRFMSDDRGRGRSRDDADRGGSYRGSGRDGERSGGSRGGDGRGWYGDREGHSEASRRGWQNSDHEGSGWYGDREGHSEASRRGWQNSDHEGSGWYGDRQGHSDASRRGWDDGHRSDQGGRGGRSRDHDDRGGRRMSRDDDGRSHGGWFGDSRGHSEASRRGWDNRH